MNASQPKATLLMTQLKRTDSQETLLPLVASDAEGKDVSDDREIHTDEEKPSRTCTVWLPSSFPLPSFITQRQIAAEYEQLAVEYAARHPAEAGEFAATSTPTPGRLEAGVGRCPSCTRSSLSLTSNMAFSFLDALLGLIWYLRMTLLLILASTFATLASAFFGWLLGTFAILGFLEPFTVLTFHAAVTALGLGSLVLGPSIGGLCALKLMFRRARMSREEKRALDEVVKDEYGWIKSGPGSGCLGGNEEPQELMYALPVSLVAGAFALAVGFAVRPSLLAEVNALPEEAVEAGKEVVAFGVKHALALGVWGFSVPFVPFAVGAFVGTLWNCAPAEGAECVAECCCSAR
ncbi:hypothetical protein C8Q76DRAFT_800346 [Earliella scabrosa]|nr:hypothetical protein C8Q76DRAFT_800346 [Earliella scabrosa]